MNNDRLSLDCVSKYFGEQQNRVDLFYNLTISFVSGTSYAIMGPSGSGKSTFMHLLAGIEQPTSGNLYFNDTNVEALGPQERQRFFNRTIGIVFQQPYLIKELTITENIILPGLIANKVLAECIKRAEELMLAVGIIEKKSAKPAHLSGGQQQRVSIARALFNEPAFLLADEPTGNLDEQTARSITTLLIDCQKRWHMGMIISTHDNEIAKRMENRLFLSDHSLTQELS